MADNASVALMELVRQASLDRNLDLMRDGARVLAEAIMEAEVAKHVGAGPNERTTEPAYNG